MKVRGKGIACMYFGMGNTGKPNPSSAFIELLEDGTANVLCGAADIGQGSNTVLSQIAAQELGIPLEGISIISADSAVTPESGVSSASRQTYISGNAVRLAAQDAREQLFNAVAEILNVSPKRLSAKDGYIFLLDRPDYRISIGEVVTHCWRRGKVIMGTGNFNPGILPLDEETGQGVPYATYSYGTQVAEVELDTETGEINIIKITAAHDVGKAINPVNVEGQLEGGASMGVGFSLAEEVVLENGRIKNPNFHEYLIPTALDMPDFDPIIVEAAEPTGPYGAKGIGEPATVPVAAAILNAIADAVGARVKELPNTAERVFMALQEQAINKS